MENTSNQQTPDEIPPQEQLHDLSLYVKEIQVQYSLNACIVALLVAVVLQTMSYLLFGTIRTDFDKVLYMFSMLIGPSAFFLLLLHINELFGIMKRGEKSIPLTLDLMYFLYVSFAFVTMVGLQTYYQRHGIVATMFSQGWNLAVGLLCGEVLLALLFAKFLVTIFVAPRFPHFFIPASSKPVHHHHLLLPERLPHQRQVYYFKQKQDVTRWETQDCFVKYKK
jgi:hypothetical protein